MSFLVAAVDDHARATASHEPDRKGGAVIDEFRYRDGILHAEEVSLLDVATATGTPFYLYSSRMFTAGLDAFHAALRGFDHLVCFSVKANSNVAILRLLGNHGAGMDVVSGGEYLRAKAAGIPGDRIVFSGVGKTREEMALAIEGGIRHFNVESEPELRQLSEVATSLGAVVPIAIRINPDVDPGTHEKISTGKSGDKFGIPMLRVRDAYAEAGRLPGVSVVGIDVHIGSQITDLAPFGRVFDLLAELTRTLRSDGPSTSGGSTWAAGLASTTAPATPRSHRLQIMARCSAIALATSMSKSMSSPAGSLPGTRASWSVRSSTERPAGTETS